MLRVDYTNRIGYYTEQQGEKKYKVWICHANCLCAMMYFYKKEEDGKETSMAQLQAFLSDNVHAKRCIKDGLFDHCSNFHFYSKEMTQELWKLVKDLTAKGFTVTIK